jgi:hypothetical protein
MRRLILVLAAPALLLLAAPPATAGPTCQDQSGMTVRCGTAGAMPVGWTAPGSRAAGVGPTPTQVLGLAGAIGGLFALLALLPDFDGRDWDRQEGDEGPRR